MTTEAPIILQGAGGYSVKSAAGQASAYYSQPFFAASGILKIAERTIPVTGEAWLDREWSSQPLADDQSGWDWFSLHFDSGDKLMAFRLRGTGASFISATWIARDGRTTVLDRDSIVLTPIDTASVAGRILPVRWRIEIPVRGVRVTTRALNTQAWMATSVPYWEGPIRFSGTHSGRGYLEMTGYE